MFPMITLRAENILHHQTQKPQCSKKVMRGPTDIQATCAMVRPSLTDMTELVGYRPNQAPTTRS